jgi:hypothetical protein
MAIIEIVSSRIHQRSPISLVQQRKCPVIVFVNQLQQIVILVIQVDLNSVFHQISFKCQNNLSFLRFVFAYSWEGRTIVGRRSVYNNRKSCAKINLGVVNRMRKIGLFRGETITEL